MHAIVCNQHGDPDVMEYVEIERPHIGPREVLIRAEAIGVNYVDTMRRSGRHPAAPPTPFTPGIEVCGRIEAIGNNVQRFKVGDRVIGRCVTHGAYAEFVAVEECFTLNCPEDISAEQAAALFVTGQTAYHALITKGAVRKQDRVLITAATGGVGSCAIQIAKLLAGSVIAAAGSEAKCQVARELGANTVINYSSPEWHQQVVQATDGEGADLIIESVGGQTTQECSKCWALNGRMVIYGKASGKIGMVSGDDLLFGNRTVFGLAAGMVIVNEPIMRSAMDQLTTWLESGDLKLLIGKTYALQDAAQAHRDLESRKTIGKLILKP